MAYPVRLIEPQTIYFLTSRTVESRFLMRPSDKANDLIGGIFARAVRKCGVEIFAYVFTSNHFHAMVRAPSNIVMSEFMRQLKSEIAIKINRLHGRRGPFFARRYSAEPIVDDDAQIGRLVYILSHGVKEGLVSKVSKWPGLSCAKSLLDGGTASLHRWRNWTRRWRMEADKKIKVGRFSDDCPSDTESLTLTPLPCWAGLTAQQRSRRIEELVADIDATAPNKATRNAAHLARQSPYGRPEQTKRTPRPKAHASTHGLWIEAVHRYRAFLAAYRQASRQWLAGNFNAQFPPHCFRPPPVRVPITIV